MIDLYREVIAIDSSPSSGTSDIVQFLESLPECQRATIKTQENIVHGIRQKNILAIFAPSPDVKSQRSGLCLQSHLDTNDPGNLRDWDVCAGDPYRMVKHNQSYYGLGVSSGKLDFVTKILAVSKLQDSLIKPFYLLGTYGGEFGMGGSSKSLSLMPDKPELLVVGIPTNMQWASSSLGIIVYEVFVPFSEEERQLRQEHNLEEGISSQTRIFQGRLAHASNPKSGICAISKAISFLKQFPPGTLLLNMNGGQNYNSVPDSCLLEFDHKGGFVARATESIINLFEGLNTMDEKFKQYTDKDFSPEYSTMNVGTVRTMNEGLSFMGSCRLVPGVPEGIIKEWLDFFKKICAESQVLLRLKYYRKGFNQKKLSISPFNLLLDDKCKPLAVSVCTEASVFQKNQIPTLLLGPGQLLGNVGSPNENILCSDIKKAQNFYEQLIKRFCI